MRWRSSAPVPATGSGPERRRASRGLRWAAWAAGALLVCSAVAAMVPTDTASAATKSLAAPTGVAVSNVTASTFTLSWKAVTGATGYDIYRNGAYNASSKTLSWSSPTWAAGTYKVQVVATAPGAYSAKSTAVTVTLTGAPGTPSPSPTTTATATATATLPQPRRRRRP